MSDETLSWSWRASMWTHGQRIILEQDRSRDRRTDQQCTVSVKPHAITLRCTSPAMVPPPCSAAALCAVGVALTLGSAAAAGVDPDEGDAVSRVADQFGQ
jgi:hypothetical protein